VDKPQINPPSLTKAVLAIPNPCSQNRNSSVLRLTEVFSEAVAMPNSRNTMHEPVHGHGAGCLWRL